MGGMGRVGGVGGMNGWGGLCARGEAQATQVAGAECASHAFIATDASAVLVVVIDGIHRATFVTDGTRSGC